MRAAQDGSRTAGAALPVGDPWISWPYQPAVRTFRAGLYGDDLSFLQAGLPAVFVSDSSFTAYYPWYHTPDDTRTSSTRRRWPGWGRRCWARSRRWAACRAAPSHEPDWFAAFGSVCSRAVLLAVGVLSLAPSLRVAARAGGTTLGLRLAHAASFGLILWRHPVPALWVFLLPNLAAALPPRPAVRIAAALPLVALVALGLAAMLRGMAAGLWLTWWELALAGAALVLAEAGRPHAPARARRGKRR